MYVWIERTNAYVNRAVSGKCVLNSVSNLTAANLSHSSGHQRFNCRDLYFLPRILV